MNSIWGLITENHSINDAALQQLQNRISVKQFKKGTILQKEGDLSNTCYFVKTGILRSFVIDQKGKEHVFMFAPEGWIMSDIVSQANHVPSSLFIDVVEDAQVEVFNKTFLEELISLEPESAKKGTLTLMKRNAVLQHRVIMLMSATALERYSHFFETYPSIVQRVPQKMIASYLGITPEALSKIRSDSSKKR